MRLTILAALIATSVAPLVSAQQVERHTVRGPRVAVYNLAGRLTAEGTTASDATVEITRGGADASKLRVEQGAVSGDEALRVIYPGDRVLYPRVGRFGRTTVTVRGDGTFGGGTMFTGRRVEVGGAGSGTEAYADIKVSVPKGAQVKLFLALGEVVVSNVDGKLAVDVASGTVTSTGGRGDLSVDTGSGSINVGNHQGNVTLDTGSGGVTLNGVRGDRVSIDTGSGSINGSDIQATSLIGDTGSGSFRLSAIRASSLRLDTGSGSAVVDLASDPDDVMIDTGSGSVTLTLPASAGADLRLSTGSGSASTDFTVQSSRRERSALSGAIGDGKGRVVIDSGSGSVRVLKGR